MITCKDLGSWCADRRAWEAVQVEVATNARRYRPAVPLGGSGILRVSWCRDSVAEIQRRSRAHTTVTQVTAQSYVSKLLGGARARSAVGTRVAFRIEIGLEGAEA